MYSVANIRIYCKITEQILYRDVKGGSKTLPYGKVHCKPLNYNSPFQNNLTKMVANGIEALYN